MLVQTHPSNLCPCTLECRLVHLWGGWRPKNSPRSLKNKVNQKIVKTYLRGHQTLQTENYCHFHPSLTWRYARLHWFHATLWSLNDSSGFCHFPRSPSSDQRFGFVKGPCGVFPIIYDIIYRIFQFSYINSINRSFLSIIYYLINQRTISNHKYFLI